MDDGRLTPRQALDAMVIFLTKYQAETHSEDIDQIVHEITYLYTARDGSPLTSEPGAWSDWIKAVRHVLNDR